MVLACLPTWQPPARAEERVPLSEACPLQPSAGPPGPFGSGHWGQVPVACSVDCLMLEVFFCMPDGIEQWWKSEGLWDWTLPGSKPWPPPLSQVWPWVVLLINLIFKRKIIIVPTLWGGCENKWLKGIYTVSKWHKVKNTIKLAFKIHVFIQNWDGAGWTEKTMCFQKTEKMFLCRMKTNSFPRV